MATYRNAIVLGLGGSGMAAACLLLAEGARVTVVDSSDNERLRESQSELISRGAEVFLNCSELPDGEFDICIVSPGIASHSEWVCSAEKRMPVISELELGVSRCVCPTVAITGTNGKSTLAKLCCDSLSGAGLKAEIGGNYGTPISSLVQQSGELDWMVIEVSSFQLEKVKTFRPRIGVLLNIQPDHLDRHIDMVEYRRLKSSMFSRMGANDTGIVLYSELAETKGISGGSNEWISFGSDKDVGYRYESGRIIWTKDGQIREIDISGSYFDNSVLGLTASAATAVLTACGLEEAQISQAMLSFEPLSHRMEEAGIIGGVRYIDDSKATNLTAMIAGVEMAGESVRLIAGGQLKEKSLSNVKEVLAKRVKRVYLIGEASDEMNDAWGSSVDCMKCGDLINAVRMARNDATEGDVVLLSPGCASFDQFKNYKDRGNQFKEIVKKEI